MNDGAATRGRCVLIVEDEMCLAMMIEDILARAGYVVLKAARLPAALALAGEECIDAAILDINLAGKLVFPVADALRRSGVPMLFTSGYGQDGLPEDYVDCPMLQKPYHVEHLLVVLGGLLDRPMLQP
ncbi:response regulator [soil metagenome]